MKISAIILVGLLALALTMSNLQSAVDNSAIETVSATAQAQSIDQITGIWHGFPSGILIQINENGSAQFGQDRDGKLIGYRAEIRSEKQQFHIRFTDYFGPEASCRSASGSYLVQLHESGAIRFKPVHDECLLRLQLLAGQSDVGMLYHRFDRR